MSNINGVDWINEGKRVLCELNPGEFTHKGIATKIGMAPGTLRRRSENLCELHECFKYSSSHQRWSFYNRGRIIQEALECKSYEELEKRLKEKYGLKFNGQNLSKFLEGTEYEVSYLRDRLVSKREFLENELLSYLVGYFIGDGSYRGKYVSWFSSKEEYLKRFKSVSSNFVWREYHEGKFFELMWSLPGLKRLFLGLGIPERKTYCDYELIGLENLNKVEFLAGWIDADGWKADRGTRYCVTNSSKLLTSQVVAMLGVDAKLRKEKMEKHCVMQTVSLSKRLSYVISRESKFLMKRMDVEDVKDKQSKVRKKNWDTRDCLRYISTGDGMFLCEWGSDS